MKIIWLGHGSFRIEIADQVLLLDPWLSGNPWLNEAQHEPAIAGATHVLVSHAHDDHATDAIKIARDFEIPAVGMYELMGWWEETEAIKTIGFNRGGTIALGQVEVTMVAASHSSSVHTPNGPMYGGTECGFMIRGEGRTIYFSGDTDVMADMEIFEDLHAPDIGIMSAGGYYTMDMKRVAYAAKRFFNFKTLIPCHYRTFPFMEQNADLLVKALPDVQIIEPEVLQAIEI